MPQPDRDQELGARQSSVRIPAGSFFYERVIPALLILLAVMTVIIVLLAAGVLLGIVPYR